MTIDVEEVEGNEAHRIRCGAATRLSWVGHVHAALQPGETGAPVLAKGHDLTVDDARGHAEELPDVGKLGEGGGHVEIVPALGPDPATFDKEDGAHAVPFDFEGPMTLVGGEFARHRQHGLDGGGQRIGPRRRTVPMDHPVAILRLEQHEPAGRPGAVEHELHLGVRPLLDVVATGIPDRHLPAAVLPFGNLSFEGGVLERVILGVDGEVVLFRRLGQPLGQRPRHEDAAALEPKIPVQAARVMFLDHESLGAAPRWGVLAHRLGASCGGPAWPGTYRAASRHSRCPGAWPSVSRTHRSQQGRNRARLRLRSTTAQPRETRRPGGSRAFPARRDNRCSAPGVGLSLHALYALDDEGGLGSHDHRHHLLAMSVSTIREGNPADAKTRAELDCGLGLAGVVAVLVSAWGGIVPYVGPLFNYSGDGSGSWHWSLAHAVLSLVPGAAGVLLGLFVIAESRGVAVGQGQAEPRDGGDAAHDLRGLVCHRTAGLAGDLEQWHVHRCSHPLPPPRV